MLLVTKQSKVESVNKKVETSAYISHPYARAKQKYWQKLLKFESSQVILSSVKEFKQL